MKAPEHGTKDKTYLFNNATQVGIGIITYKDQQGADYVLLARLDPRWKFKENSEYLQFTGGKVDEKDKGLNLLKSSGVAVELTTQFNNFCSKSTKPDAKARAQYSTHMLTLLEGCIREVGEETNIKLEDYLKKALANSGFIKHKLTTRHDHSLTNATDLHYFHIHLGQLSIKQERKLHNQLNLQANSATQGELLLAGFIPLKSLKESKAFGYYVEDPFQHMKNREAIWVPPGEQRMSKLNETIRREQEEINTSCEHDGSLRLKDDRARNWQQFFPPATGHDEGAILASILEELRRPKGKANTTIIVPASYEKHISEPSTALSVTH